MVDGGELYVKGHECCDANDAPQNEVISYPFFIIEYTEFVLHITV